MAHAFLLSLLLLGAPAGGAVPEGDTIVITGTPMRVTERALKECLARKCSPEEDIDASLAHAENLFVAGDYKKARSVTKASIGRNARHARKLPVPVSDLWRANGRISAHLGESWDYRWSTTAIRRTLKAGLPIDDPRLIGASLEAASMYASLGHSERASQIYKEAQDDAIRIGRPDLAGVARVRAAWLQELGGYTQSARATLRNIASDRSPGARVPRLAALVLLARLDRRQGKTGSADALIAELRSLRSTKPFLLFSPPISIPAGLGPMTSKSGSVGPLTEHEDIDVWVDIGFWVTPDGKVSEAEVLRSNGSTRWAAPLLRSIQGRLYSPMAGGQGAYRVERYTHTALWMIATGTRIKVRAPETRVEYMDLTEEPDRKPK